MTPSQATLTPLPDRPDLSDPGKVSDWLRDRYMRNPRDFDFEDALREILRTGPDGALTAEPMQFGLVRETRGLLMTAESGAGKTTLIRRNLLRQPQIGWTEDTSPGRAFYIRVRSEFTLKGFPAAIAKATGYPAVSERLRASEIWDLALHRLRRQGITILWIDEAHHMFRNAREKDDVIHRFKTLMQDEPNFALILSGIPTLEEHINTDAETSGRLFRMRLGPIRSEAERESLRAYIARCCELVELEAPDDPHIVDRLEAGTRGSFGRSIEFIQFAITRALRRRDGRLTLDDFRRSFGLRSGTAGEGPFDAEDWPTLKQILESQGWSP